VVDRSSGADALMAPSRIEAGALSDHSPLSLPQLYRGKGINNNSTTSSFAVNVEVSHQKEDNREQRESNDDPSSSKEKVPTRPRKHVSPSVNTSSSPNTEADKSTTIQGVLVRLGTPDHQGWMLKQGRRVDVWKNRYFVLKDSYLYWLKSDSLLVRVAPAGWWGKRRLIVSDPIGDKGQGIYQCRRMSHRPSRKR
jgi:hypothetical protein